METKKYLTEENYEKGKRKLKFISLTILVVGLLLGGILIITGIVNTKNEMTENKTKRTESVVKEEIAEIESKITAINLEINNIEAQIERLNDEQFQFYREDKAYTDRYYAKGAEITTKENEITLKENERTKLENSQTELNDELWEMQSGFNSVENLISYSKYVPLFILGTSIIGTSCIIAGIIYFISKRREITAFTAQQVIPIAKEGIDEMAPTIGNAVGEITKGIKNGLNNEEK